MATYVVMKENTSDHSSDYTLYAGTKAGKAMNKVENEEKDSTYTEVWVRGEHLYTVTGNSRFEEWWVYRFSDENNYRYHWKDYTLQDLLFKLAVGTL